MLRAVPGILCLSYYGGCGLINATQFIGGSSDKHARHEEDFYPTPVDCTLALIRKFPHLASGLVWEPACGDGAIAKILVGAGAQVVGTDLHDRGYGTGGLDFLTAQAPEGVTAIVTNPPFGIAAEFIRHSRTFGVPFAMLLKSVYWHAKSRHSLFLETGPAYVCPLLWRPATRPERGKSAVMEFAWTVWDAQPAPYCQYVQLERPTLEDPVEDLDFNL